MGLVRMHRGIGICLALGIMDTIHEPCTDWIALSGDTQNLYAVRDD